MSIPDHMHPMAVVIANNGLTQSGNLVKSRKATACKVQLNGREMIC